MSVQNLISQHRTTSTESQEQVTDSEAAYLRGLKEDLKVGNPVKVVDGKIVRADPKNRDMGQDLPQEIVFVEQWHESDKSLLEDEVEAMNFLFSGFQLLQLPDKRLAWQGIVAPNLVTGKKWEILAVYDHDHPQERGGSSVKVFLVNPTLDELCQRLGFIPHHILRSEQDGRYLCTMAPDAVKKGERVTSAANNLLRASKWLICAEMVLLGMMTREEFDGRIGT